MFAKNTVLYLSVFHIIKAKAASGEITNGEKYISFIVCCQCPYIYFDMVSQKEMMLFGCFPFQLGLHQLMTWKYWIQVSPLLFKWENRRGIYQFVGF